ncbi:hypothetical protein COOONC_21587 [Cooperia oncophora]
MSAIGGLQTGLGLGSLQNSFSQSLLHAPGQIDDASSFYGTTQALPSSLNQSLQQQDKLKLMDNLSNSLNASPFQGTLPLNTNYNSCQYLGPEVSSH